MLIRQPNVMALEYLYGISWKWLMTGEGEMWATELPAWIAARLEGIEPFRPTAPSPEKTEPPKVDPKHRVAPGLQAPPMDPMQQAALQLAIEHCKASGAIGDPESLVRAFKDILARLQS